jgi:hypothetical protein
VTRIVDRLNDEVEEGEERVKADSVRKALRRGMATRFRKEGEQWSVAA